MSRSRSRFAVLLAVLAAVGGFAWRLVSGERPSELRSTPTSEEGVEGERLPPELQLASEPAERERIAEALEPATARPTGVVARGKEILARIQERETVATRATPDLVWWGQIVDGTSQAPLADARVELVTGNPFTEHTGEATTLGAADGMVQLTPASWRASYLRVELEGYASGFVHMDPGHEQPATACRVRLLRGATLALSVTDPNGAPRPGLELRVSGAAHERVQGDSGSALGLEALPFVAYANASGRCTVEALPPEVPLSLELLEGTQSLRREERRLRLEPGESRSLSWTVGGCCTLRGRTLDADGSAAVGVTVWLVPDLNGMWRHGDSDKVTAQARSDTNGRFTLEVAAGTWLVGPAPTQSGAFSARGPLTDIGPVEMRVTIAPEQTSAELTLICSPGLFLRGTVKGPEGEPVLSGYVDAMGEDMSTMANLRDGAFSIGPLAPGSYALRAISDDDALVDSEPHIVAAGTEGIEIVLHRGASVSVRVLDARCNPAVDVPVWILSETPRYGNRVHTRIDGTAALANVPPGTFSLSAATAAGEFALARGVSLGATGAPREIELRLEPAARLRVEVRNGPGVAMQTVLFLDGDPVGYMFLDEGPVTALAQGEYEVALWGESQEEVQRQRVHVAAEGEARVVFDLGAPR